LNYFINLKIFLCYCNKDAEKDEQKDEQKTNKRWTKDEQKTNKRCGTFVKLL